MSDTEAGFASIEGMAFCLEDFLFDVGTAKRVWKPLIRRLVAGRRSPLVMRPGEPDFPARVKRLGLYLHVPFCRNLCPFCPYNRVEYDEAAYREFERAAHQEIDLCARRMEDARRRAGAERPPVVSLYVGGGTPTVDPKGLARLLSHMRESFGEPGDICAELHPAAMDDDCLGLLKGAGVTMLSIGVESLNDRLLEVIGRSHDAAAAEDALRRAVSAGFGSVNADLMFALPTQTLEELDSDLSRVLESGVDQVSTYPIFGFPYSDLGKRMGMRAIKRPPGTMIRRMLDLIRARCLEAGLKQCAVWSFLKPGEKKFSSITRHHYLGFGPSGASMTGSEFRVNTFSVKEYAAALPGRLPVALTLPVDRRLEMAYWFYWRLYEMKASGADFKELFGRRFDDVFGGLMLVPRLLGLARKENGGTVVTEKGAYWIHRFQNEYSLNYINRLWGRCRAEPWPDEVRL